MITASSSHSVPAAAAARSELVIATYNIGAKTDDHYRSNRMCSHFSSKLEGDFEKLASRANVIGIQEIAPYWCNFVQGVLSPGWKHFYLESNCIATFYKDSDNYLH